MTTPPLPPEDAAAPDPERGPSADQKPSMTSHLAAEHLSLDELADISVGELSPDAVAGAETHLAGCESCRTELAQLTAEMGTVTEGLSGLDPLLEDAVLDGAAPESGGRPAMLAPMPVTVAARLDRTLAAESELRRVSGGGTVLPFAGSAPLRAPATASYVKQTGVVKLMLAAAVAAAVVGFGGYVISASAGLNEPSALSPTQVHPEALASQAGELAESRDPDPHLFSAAWRCARKVTPGRITGITPVYVDGEQNYLVYTRSGGVTYATLVSGCGTSTPTAGRPVRLSE